MLCPLSRELMMFCFGFSLKLQYQPNDRRNMSKILNEISRLRGRNTVYMTNTSCAFRQLHRGGHVQHDVHPAERAVGGGQEHLAGGHRRLLAQHGRRIRVSQIGRS